jgi:predicted MFS family arabinose efflux permease
MLYKVFKSYFSKYKGIPKNIWWLSLVNLINRMGTMVYPFMTIYMTRSLGFSISAAGFVMACFGVGAILGSYLGGKFTDKFGFYKVQIFTLMGGGIMFFILGYLENYVAICITSFLLSAVNEAFRPANISALGYFTTKENNTKSFSLNRLAFNLGWSVGGSIGGIVASINYQSLFWIDGCTNIFAAIALIIIFKDVEIIKPLEINKPTNITRPTQDKFFMFFCLNTFLFAACFFQHFTNLPAFYKNMYNFNESFIGFLFTLNGLIIVVFEMNLIHYVNKFRLNKKIISIGHILHAFAFILLILIPITYFSSTIQFILITVSEMLAFPAMYAIWINRTNEYNRGSYAGWNAMSWALAQTVGPFGGALIADHLGFNWLWGLVVVLNIITAYNFYNLSKENVKII